MANSQRKISKNDSRSWSLHHHAPVYFLEGCHSCMYRQSLTYGFSTSQWCKSNTHSIGAVLGLLNFDLHRAVKTQENRHDVLVVLASVCNPRSEWPCDCGDKQPVHWQPFCTRIAILFFFSFSVQYSIHWIFNTIKHALC